MGSSPRVNGGRTAFGVLVTCTAVLVALVVGCNEKEVPVASDSTEILNYIERSADAVELFDTDSIWLPNPYKIPGDTTTYMDSIVSRSRTYDYAVSTGSVPDSVGGSAREAWVGVYDSFVLTRSWSGHQDTFDFTVRRYGYFLKLGSDAQEFLGWKLWGYNGIGLFSPPATASLRKLDLSTIQLSQPAGYPLSPQITDTNLRFQRLDRIPTLPQGTPMVLKALQSATSTTAMHHIVTAGDGGPIQSKNMIRIGINDFVDTLTVPSPNSHNWNLVTVRSYQEVAQGNVEPVSVWTMIYRTDL